MQYLKEWQDSLKGNPYGEVLSLGPKSRLKWVFTDFVEQMLDGWLKNTVAIGPQSVRIGGNFYSIPADLNAFWRYIEDLTEETPIDTIIENFQKEKENGK